MPIWLWPVCFVVAVGTSAHAILHKREIRSVIGWLGLFWLGAPLIGAMLYFCFGINRIRRRGNALQQQLAESFREIRVDVPEQVLQQFEQARVRYPCFAQMVDLVTSLTGNPLLPGNRIQPLINGDQAYPAMLEAIHGAQQSIALQSYIFDFDRAGAEFVQALAQAQQRQVEIRVLVDDVGARYLRPSIVGELRRVGIPCRTFLPRRGPRSVQYANLRNHRKLMIVDGEIGFTGGINIREACRLDWNPAHPVQDIHFRLEGPVVTQLQEMFACDWAFVAQEILDGAAWMARPRLVGEMWARGVPDGPDEDFEKLLLTILGAIGVAQRRLIVVSPYFLPDRSIVNALGIAALRGVQVDIVLPQVNNLRLIQWACMATLWQVLERGCQVHLSPLPFDHSKLLIVDDAYMLFGSTNWDARSLRLNFEFNVETYSTELCEQITQVIDEKINRAQRLTLADVNARSLPIKLRDGIARLFTPYL
ncbi:MAG: cardiolipin synthase [Planctomycetaceae bacterium]|nr:cardiolipin synthase [Planctomycetaceae bacterium]